MRSHDIGGALPGARAELSAILIHADGSREDRGVISGATMPTFLARPIAWWKALWNKLRRSGIIPLSMCFVAFMSLHGSAQSLLSLPLFGLVTTAGVNFLAVDMASGQASPRISSMNFHDSGTGTSAAAIGDTTLQTQAGPATRATGVQSNPIAGTYKTVGIITYSGPLAITEWGAFNQSAQGGTLWDHRVFSAINVVNLDSIQFSYSLVVNAGGS